MEYHYNRDNIPAGGDELTSENTQGAQQPRDTSYNQYQSPYGGQNDAGHKSGWPYTQSSPPHTQPAYEAPRPEARYEARYVPQYEVKTDGAGGGNPSPRKKGGFGKAMGAIGLVVACAVAGFGGGYAAVSTYGDGTADQPSVSAPADDGTTPSGINTTDDMTVSEISKKAGQSVVSITTENMVSDYFAGGRVVSGAGSGVIISKDGVIITNNHVVSGAQNITVTLPDGTEYPATVVGTDASTDIAVIKINATGLTPATVADSADISVGDFCIAIGNPMGTLGGTVTDGIVSALDREITIDGYTMNLLQMNAAVSPGNSGGGLFNNRGELIGIVNAKSSGDGAEGLGFAIPTNTAMQIAETIIENGYVVRPGLGVSVFTAVTQEEAEAQGYAQPGLYIQDVNPGSAAEVAGMQLGDRVVEADGVSISSLNDLRGVLDSNKVGDTIDITVERGGTTLGLSVTLQEVTG